MRDQSELLTVAHLSWVTWVIHSQSLICLERSEQITHNRSFDLSKMTKWANDWWANEQIPSPGLELEKYCSASKKRKNFTYKVHFYYLLLFKRRKNEHHFKMYLVDKWCYVQQCLKDEERPRTQPHTASTSLQGNSPVYSVQVEQFGNIPPQTGESELSYIEGKDYLKHSATERGIWAQLYWG